ncbi:hypothetical protein PRNP1_001307 [Phytophthora ramorum]
MADLVFPWFAWIMGFSTFLSSSGRRYSLIRPIQRAVKLFALGLFVNNGDSWSEWRIPGVLQSLSVATVGAWRGAPFNSVGKNSIAIYVMHETCQHFAPFAAKPVTVGEDVPHFELLFFNLVGMFTWIVIAQWMDLQRIFIKV